MPNKNVHIDATPGIQPASGNSGRPMPEYTMSAHNVLLRALQFMKLFPTSYVFTGEEKAKLYVAEKRDDDSNTETTAASRRSPESFAGADCGTSPALERRREYASGPSATGFF